MGSEAQIVHENHSGVNVTVANDEVRLSVDAEGLGLGEAAFASIGTETGDVAAGDDPRFGQSVLPLIVGGHGFQGAGGNVTLDLSLGWTFHLQANSDITGLSFSNLPNSNVTSAIVRLVIKQDATGGRAIAEPSNLVFRDGRTWADLVTGPNAENRVWLERVGSSWDAYLDNGVLELEDLHLHFVAAATLKIAVRRPQVIDVASALVDGAGSVTYERTPSGGSKGEITTSTAFGAGDLLHVTAAVDQSVTIPRYL